MQLLNVPNFRSYQEVFLKNGNLVIAAKNDVTLSFERDRARNLYSQGFTLSNLDPMWLSAHDQPDGDIEKLSLLMMHLLINYKYIIVAYTHLISLQNW